MSSWLIWIVAIISIAVCLFLWFRDVRRIMRERKSTVESAAGQLASSRKKAASVRYDLELEKVVTRSESIYRQAVELYHQAFNKPWIWLPAILMGFRAIPPEESYTLGRNWTI